GLRNANYKSKRSTSKFILDAFWFERALLRPRATFTESPPARTAPKPRSPSSGLPENPQTMSSKSSATPTAAEPATPPADTLATLRGPAVRLLVGPSRELLDLHRAIALRVPFLRQALKRSHSDAANGAVELPEEEWEPIARVVSFLYFGKVSVGSELEWTEKRLELAKAYLVAEKWMADKASEAFLKALRDAGPPPRPEGVSEAETAVLWLGYWKQIYELTEPKGPGAYLRILGEPSFHACEMVRALHRTAELDAIEDLPGLTVDLLRRAGEEELKARAPKKPQVAPQPAEPFAPPPANPVKLPAGFSFGAATSGPGIQVAAQPASFFGPAGFGTQPFAPPAPPQQPATSSHPAASSQPAPALFTFGGSST
ncbi:hypothetical protein DFJ74DRAFT_717726, partial [Hyaloraphidium curvatum]